MRVLWLALLSSGCVGVTTLNGARPNAPGETTTHVGVSNKVLTAQLRHGLAPDLDLGITLRNASLGTDLRVRFFRSEHIHLATAPGITLIANGVSFSNSPVGDQYAGFFDVSLPLMAEWQINRHWSVTLAPRLTVSHRFVANDPDGAFLQEDVTWAVLQPQIGGRVQWDVGRLAVGVSADVRSSAVQDVRWQPFFGADITTSLGFRGRHEGRRIRRQVRREDR
ncbi:MAG: hypothetical protein ACJAZO_002745 [Myxococcota bacterium]|jgi:hypothetical protein